MSAVLGLDVGPNSLGWALLDDEAGKIIDMGVRIFQEGVNDLGTGKEASKNATRQEKRQMRRMIMRRHRRKESLMRALIENKMITVPDEEFAKIDPYAARRNALYRKLDMNEFARALYHIGQRRGFLSNRKTDGADEKEDGAIFKGGAAGTTGITELQDEIIKGGYQTLGEYLYTLDSNIKRLRNRYTLRKMYIEEFDIIWEKQALYYPEILTDKLRDFIRNNIMFFQRPLKSQKHLIGKCNFEKDKPRAKKASFEYQEFRMLQQVNNLIISGGDRIDEAAQYLSEDERARLLTHLYENGSLKIDNEVSGNFLKLLGLGQHGKYYCNLGHQKKLDGLKTVYSLRKAVKNWDDLSDEVKQQMLDALYFAEDTEWLIKYAQKKTIINKKGVEKPHWGLSEQEAKDYAKITLEKNYGSLSVKAIRKLLPDMRDGLMYDEAAAKVGYDHSLYSEKPEQMEYLPKPPHIANPIVKVSLNQIRTVVNAIIERYGNPETIRVELSRELKIPHKRRMDIQSDNQKREKKALEIKEILQKEIKIKHPSKNDILKYRLWEECDHICPYTGKQISLSQLFGEMPEFEIEHIIPYSRSLDDSYMNKALCWKAENIRKSNKTPYELYAGSPEQYMEIKERIKYFPLGKARKFQQKELDDDFISRQLNDTRYIASSARHYLQHVTAEVTVGNGSVTSYLRQQWGLNGTYDNPFLIDDIDVVPRYTNQSKRKNRKDHRHHAIDAVVVALTSRSLLQKLSTAYQKNAYFDDEGNITNSPTEIFRGIKVDKPWDTLFHDVKYHAARILISHKCDKRVTGGLHEETLYGRVTDENGIDMVNEKGKQLYTIRKPIAALTTGEILQITDPVVKEVVLDRCLEHGATINNKGVLDKIPKTAFVEPLFLPSPRKGCPNQIKKVRIRKPFGNSINIRDYNVWVEPGNNHHAIIYTDEKGKVREKMVTLYEAANRQIQGLPVPDTTLEPGLEFWGSLQKNEMFFHGALPENIDWNDKSNYNKIFDNIYRLQKMSSKDYFFKNHSIAILDSQTTANKQYAPGLNRLSSLTPILQLHKVQIDPIGFIKLSNS